MEVLDKTINTMKNGSVIGDDFLLYSEKARILYHDYAKDMPIIDYHNHLPPQEIAEAKQFKTITEIWLKGDHYKWRAMRTLGVNERFITGDATDEEKFMAWAEVVPSTIRNPLFHWTHMELKNPFGINQFLNKDSAKEIYAHCNHLLAQENFSTQLGASAWYSTIENKRSGQDGDRQVYSVFSNTNYGYYKYCLFNN